MWPWQRTDRAAGAPAASAPAWRSLPPIQRSLGPLAPVAPREEFAASLQTWRNPSFLAPLGHLVSPDAPAGVIDGLLSPASAPLAHSDGPPLAFAQRPARRRGVVQRMLTAFAGPPEPALPVQAPTVDQPPPPPPAVPVQRAAANARPLTPAVTVQRASADAATPLTQAPPLDLPELELPVLSVLPSTDTDVVAETPTLGTGRGSGSGHEIRSGTGHAPLGTSSPPELAGGPVPISTPHEHPAPAQRSVAPLMPDTQRRPAQRDGLEPAHPFPAATDDRAPVGSFLPAEGPTVAPLLGQPDIVDAALDIDPLHELPGTPPPTSSPALDRPNPPRRLGLGAPLTPDDTRGSWPRVQRSPSLPSPTTPEPRALTMQRVPTRSAASPPEPKPERAPPAKAGPNSEVTVAPLLGQDGVVDDRGDAALVEEPPPSPPAHSDGSVALPSVQLELAAPSPPVVPPAAPTLPAPRMEPPEMVRRSTPAAAAPQVAPLVGLGGTAQRSATQTDELSGGSSVTGVTGSPGSPGSTGSVGSTPGGDLRVVLRSADADGPATGAMLPVLRVVAPNAAEPGSASPGGTSVAALDLTPPAVVVARLVGDRTLPLLTVPPSANPAADRAERPPTNGPTTTATVQRAGGPPGARLAVPGALPHAHPTPPPLVQAAPVVPVEPVTPVVQTVAVPEPLPEAPTESLPDQPSAAGGPATPATPAGGGTPDELVKKLFDPLLRRLKAELRLERERRGVLTDLRH
ncbi:MAG: hypothetical protein ACRDRP_16890 [Pseudonocardiaceae bacterium]